MNEFNTNIEAANKAISKYISRANDASEKSTAVRIKMNSRPNPPNGSEQRVIIDALCDDKEDMYRQIDALNVEVNALRTALRALGVDYR